MDGRNGTGDRLAEWDGEGYDPGLRVAPNCYAIGRGVLDELDRYVRGRLDVSDVLVFGGERALAATRDRLEGGFGRLGATCTFVRFDGECSLEQVTEYRRLAADEDPDLVVGAGGGKVIDTAKAVADGLYPVATVPTVPSTCAPLTALSVYYNEDGTHRGAAKLSRCPDWVFVDTEVLAAAPARLLASGIMDATAKYYESDRIPRDQMRPLGRLGTDVAREAYHSCLREHAVEAVEACERGELTDTLADVIEAAVAGPGLASGLLSDQSYRSLPHVLGYALLNYGEVEAKSYHGEQVAFGVLVLRAVLGDSRADLRELKGWYEAFGIDLTLENLGMSDVSFGLAAELAEDVYETLDRDLLPDGLTSDDIADAVVTVDELDGDAPE